MGIQTSTEKSGTTVLGVIGMEEWKLQQSIDKANETGICAIAANLYPLGYEVAGDAAAVEAARNFFLKKGAKRAKEIPRAVGLHTPAMNIGNDAYVKKLESSVSS